jgi:hypothetical protein
LRPDSVKVGGALGGGFAGIAVFGSVLAPSGSGHVCGAASQGPSRLLKPAGARQKSVGPGRARLNEAIGEAVANLQHETHNHRAELQLDLAPNLPAVVVGRVELQQSLSI